MDKMKLFEAIQRIDDDIVKEADDRGALLKNNASQSNGDDQLTVSGVDVYVRPKWHRFASFAAAFLLVAGLCTAGGVFLKYRKFNDSHEDMVAGESSASARTELGTEGSNSENGSASGNGESQTEAAEVRIPGATEATEAAVDGNSTVTEAYRTTSPYVTTTVPYTGTIALNTTVGYTTVSPLTTTDNNEHPPYVPSGEGVLTTKDLLALVNAKKTNGEALTWDDFKNYEHDDIGSGLYIWHYVIPEGYTLLLGGGNTAEKPAYMRLYHTEEYELDSAHSTKNCIDLRYDDVDAFINGPSRVNDAMNEIKAVKYADSVRDAEVSYSMFREKAHLSYKQICLLLEKLKNITLIEQSDQWEMLSCNYSGVKLTLSSGKTLNFGTMGSYFIIDGKGYKAQYTPCQELEQFLYSAVADANANKEKITVGRDEVWCWHDYVHEKVESMRDISESIELTSFPDCKFTWLGTQNCIMIEKKGAETAYVGGMPVWNVFFTDITGDGYPELCATVSIGSGMVDERIVVYDVRNNKSYELSNRCKYDYVLARENGELVVYEFEYASEYYSLFDGYGHKGRLGFSEANGPAFISDSVVTTVTITEINGNMLIVTPVDGSPELRSCSKFSVPAEYLNFQPVEGMVLLVDYNGTICESWPGQFGKIYSVQLVRR